MQISDKLKQRFIKDYSLHINTHIEPYFSYQLNLFGNTKEYELLIDAINTLGSEDGFFNENKRLVGSKEKEGIVANHMKQFADYSNHFIDGDYFNFVRAMFPEPSDIRRMSSLYKEYNIGKYFTSIDLVSGNFQSFKFISFAPFDQYHEYKDLIKDFTSIPYFQNSKYIRQIIFGHLNPMRQAKIMYVMTKQIYKILSEDNSITNKGEIFLMGPDELVIKYKDNIFPCFKETDTLLELKLLGQGYKVKANTFQLKTLNTTSGKYYYKDYLFEDKKELKGCSKDHYAEVYKLLHTLPINEMDTIKIEMNEDETYRVLNYQPLHLIK